MYIGFLRREEWYEKLKDCYNTGGDFDKDFKRLNLCQMSTVKTRYDCIANVTKNVRKLTKANFLQWRMSSGDEDYKFQNLELYRTEKLNFYKKLSV